MTIQQARDEVVRILNKKKSKLNIEKQNDRLKIWELEDEIYCLNLVVSLLEEREEEKRLSCL